MAAHDNDCPQDESIPQHRLMGGGPKDFYRFPDNDSVSEPSDGSGAVRVLIVDDNDLITELLSDMFAHQGGYDVRIARNGQEAVEQFRSFRPQLVILDIMLGDSDGRAICRRIKENATGGAKVIAMSGYVPMTEIPSLAMNGFDHYLRKPFRIDDVLRVVDRLELKRKPA